MLMKCVVRFDALTGCSPKWKAQKEASYSRLGEDGSFV